MTVGQRIAQKRKDLGLSQEALGEELGVSRQSVYKWESGAALPEIDKLVTMSKMFGVTIGWLLGVEETENVPEAGKLDAGKTEPGELTETQLKMVEEIVDRYLASQQPAKKRRWPWAVAAVAGIALLVFLNSLRNDLENMQWQYTNLQSAVNNVSSSVDSQIYGIANRVEEVLKNQNNLTANYGSSVLSTDLAVNTVTFNAYAAPKTFTDGMSAVFLIDDGNTTAEFPAELGENHTFNAGLTCELTEVIEISVVFITDNVRETQLLDTYYDLYNRSLPEAPYGFDFADGLMWKELSKDGTLEWHDEYEVMRLNTAVSDTESAIYYVDNTQIERAKLKSYRVGLFQNKKLLGWMEPCEKPDRYVNYAENEYDFYRYPDVSVVPEPEDVFTLAAVVVDEYDREFVFTDIGYSLERDGDELTHTTGGGTYGFDDPANWEY